MKVPLGWLSEWIDLPARDELCARLTSAGLEIEEIIETGPDLSGVRVGLVAEREPHPNADRLSLCKVDLGDGDLLDIVCGAPNVAAGQRVAVATHGVVLPGDFKIKRSKIRGVTSNGMICSSKELDLGDDHDGILVLPEDAPLGAPLPEVLPAGETVLDFEITPNRGDWVSMLGMAREVRANFGGALRLPEIVPTESARATADDVSIEVRDPDGCPRYVGRVVRGVAIGASPAWLVDRLEAAGLRSVNNVVDVTNLVMLEFGQPLHAFDLDRVQGGVVVRAAEEGEKIVTLDGQTRALERADLVIADDGGAIAVAGVMGGADSEVHDGTTNLLIESAHFHPSRVRRTARRLGLHSDASYRFERGVDPEGQARAADRAARLIAELAGGEVSGAPIEATGAPWPAPPTIELESERVNRLLGTALDVDAMIALLARVDVEATRDGDRLRCAVPRYRGDLHLAVDLIEEIARIHGYDDIAPTLPLEGLGAIEEPPRRATTDAVRRALVDAGLVEVMTFPAAPTSDAAALGLAEGDLRANPIGILNPIQSQESTLRTQLVASVLRVVHGNLAKQTQELRLFELSRVFRRNAEGGLPDEPIEAVAAFSLGGEGDLWREAQAPIFFHAKGVGERLLVACERRFEFRSECDEPYLHPGARGSFAVGGRTVAMVGELHPEVAARFDIEAPVALLVVDVDALDAVPRETPQYAAVSKHPWVRRDLAVLLERETPAGEIVEAIRKKAGSALASVDVFDRYEGKGVPEGKVSVAFRLVFQRLDRTLTEAEVTKSVERVVQLVSKRFGGELR